MLCRAQTSAPGSASTACTTASGRHAATASASAADPVHRSTTSGDDASAIAARPHSSSSSVSGRGVNTPGPTVTVTGPSTALPSRCCSGSRAARRATSCDQLLDLLGVHQRLQHQPPARHPDHVRGQQLGVHPRRPHPRGGEHPLRLHHRQPQRLPPHADTPPRGRTSEPYVHF